MGVAVGSGVGATVGGGGGAVGTMTAVGIAAGSGASVAVGRGVGVVVGTGSGVGIGVGNGVDVGMGATVGGMAIGDSSTCVGTLVASRAVAMASTSARGSLPLSGATPVTTNSSDPLLMYSEYSVPLTAGPAIAALLSPRAVNGAGSRSIPFARDSSK